MQLGRRTLVLIVAITLSAPLAVGQRRAYLAQERGDFDGDGRRDQVKLTSSGHVEIELGHSRRRSELAPGLNPKRGTIELGRLGGGTIILVRGFKGRPKRNPSGAATVYWVAKASIELLWSGAIGPQGEDREWSRELELTDKQLTLYESHPQVRGCRPDQPLRLYARAFDFGKQRRFRPFQPRSRRPAATAPRLPVTDKPPASLAGLPLALFFRAQGATSQFGSTSAADLSTPREIDDGNMTTAWLDGRGGSGTFETIVFSQPQPAQKLAAVAIIPGHGASASEFRRRGRLKQFALLLYGDGGRTEYVVDIGSDPAARGQAAHRTPVWVHLPKHIATSCVELLVLSTYRGSGARGRRDDLAIAEVQLLTDLELSPDVMRVLVDRVRASSGAAARAAIRALRRRGAKASAAVVDALKQNSTAKQKQRLYQALALIDQPSSASTLAAALMDPITSSDTRRLAASKLAGYGDHGALALLSVLVDDSTDDDTRELALDFLLKTQTQRRGGLLAEVAGKGSRTFRRSLAVALAKQEDVSLAGLAQATTIMKSAGAEADLWRAAALRARTASTKDQVELVRAMGERLTKVDDYERRYRLLQGMAPLPAASAELTRWWNTARLDASPRAIALRRVVAGAAAKNPHPAALAALALADSDPSVRTLGAAAIQADDVAPLSTTLVAVLNSDPWPMVRGNAALAIGQACLPAVAQQALVRAASSDVDPEVQRAAIRALLACAPAAARTTLLRLARDAKQPIGVRSFAVLQLAGLKDQAPIAELIELLDISRRSAFDSDDSQKLAAATATALGRLGDARGRKPLMQATQDEAYPGIQAAAAAALGSLCDKAVKIRLKALSTSPQRTVSLAAQRSLTTCR